MADGFSTRDDLLLSTGVFAHVRARYHQTMMGGRRRNLPATMRAFHDAVRSAPAVDRRGVFPRDWWGHLAERGGLGIGFDPDGRSPPAGWTAVAGLSGLIARETASLGMALAWLMNEMLGRFVIGANIGNESHRALLRMMAGGEKILALAISEPKAGAHPKHLSCRAHRQEDHWLLYGEKSYISNGPAADAFVVLAVTGERGARKSFDAFIVDARAEGLRRLPPGGAGALPPVGHCGLEFAACQVADEARLATDGCAFDRIAKPLRTLEDTLLGSMTVGAMQAQVARLADRLPGAGTRPEALAHLGALHLELSALRVLTAESVSQLEPRGPHAGLADLNAGVRIALRRWQDDFENFSATLATPAAGLAELAADVRTVLGIARRVLEARLLKAGTGLVSFEENDEVSA